jgi:hypothetical protein
VPSPRVETFSPSFTHKRILEREKNHQTSKFSTHFSMLLGA